MSAPWFILPGTCVAFSESRLVWAQTRRPFASVQRRIKTRPPWLFMYDTTDLLSERISTWCPLMSGRKKWQARHTASISRQLMCRPDSSSDQRPKVGLPSHSAPQPLLEASVVTTFLLCAVSKITPCFSQRGSLQQVRADTQARVTVMWWRPWRQAADGTLCFSQNLMGRMWSRPNWSTGKAAAIRPSIFWKALSGWTVPSLKEAARHWIVMARSAETVAVICTELITVPRNDTRWLGDSMLLAKLTLSPRRSKWLRRRVLCNVKTASD